MSNVLVKKIQACFAGAQLGDALGMPLEMKTHEEIMAETEGRDITGFMKLKKSRPDLPLGSTTDDWALVSAVAESLIRMRCYDLTDIAFSKLLTFENHYGLGWGRTTARAFEDWQVYIFSRGKTGRSPLLRAPSVEGEVGAGNGVAIQIAPLAVWWELTCKRQREPFYKELFAAVAKIGFASHPHPIAILAAFALAAMITEVLVVPICSENQKRGTLLRVMVEISRQKNCDKELANSVNLLNNRFTAVLENLDDKDKLREEIGTNCFALESVVFAIATFLRHPRDFRGALLEAVNAGGDTDSIASMVGALVGANCGLEDERGQPIIPPEWMNFNPEFQESLRLGEELFIAAQSVK